MPTPGSAWGLARHCESCGSSIEHKRVDARFCDRQCKAKASHLRLRATPEGKAAERERNKARYGHEKPRRQEYARAAYWREHEAALERARAYRHENPDRRRSAHDRRRARMLENPGYVPFARAEWERTCDRLGRRCVYCGDKPDLLVMDHVVPLAKGGRHALSNLLPACWTCNSSKGSLLLSEWRYRRGGDSPLHPSAQKSAEGLKPLASTSAR